MLLCSSLVMWFVGEPDRAGLVHWSTTSLYRVGAYVRPLLDTWVCTCFGMYITCPVIILYFGWCKVICCMWMICTVGCYA